VAPDLVTRNDKGEVETVRYEAVSAMLLNEFLKEHRKNEEQQATIARLETTAAKQEKGLQPVTAHLEEQAAQIQNVSAQPEASKPARRKWSTISKAPDNLSEAGWSLGYVSAVDSSGRTIWIADAHCGDGKRFIVSADEKLTAFLELERACSLLRASSSEPPEIDCKMQSNYS
jgi:hypothetical protein